MSQQVASLNTIVKSLQISATQNGTAAAGANGLGSHSGSASSSGGSTPSLFGPPQITRTSVPTSAGAKGVLGPDGPPSAISTGVLTAETIESNSTITPTAASSNGSSDVAALTHQIAALSASVAQLQKMQSTSVRQGLEKKLSQSGAASPELMKKAPSTAQSGTSSTSPGQTVPAIGAQPSAQTPGQAGPQQQQQQGYFPNMGGNTGRPQNARNQTGPAGGLNSSIASALGSIGSRPRPHPGRAASSSVVPGVGANNSGGQGYQSMSSIAAGTGPAGGMSLGNINMINQGAGGRIERDRLDAVTPGGMSREGGPGGMTVTKWEHLPLTPELQRQIVKYG